MATTKPTLENPALRQASAHNKLQEVDSTKMTYGGSQFEKGAKVESSGPPTLTVEGKNIDRDFGEALFIHGLKRLEVHDMPCNKGCLKHLYEFISRHVMSLREITFHFAEEQWSVHSLLTWLILVYQALGGLFYLERKLFLVLPEVWVLPPLERDPQKIDQRPPPRDVKTVWIPATAESMRVTAQIMRLCAHIFSLP